MNEVIGHSVIARQRWIDKDAVKLYLVDCQASQIVNRVADHVLGHSGVKGGNACHGNVGIVAAIGRAASGQVMNDVVGDAGSAIGHVNTVRFRGLSGFRGAIGQVGDAVTIDQAGA